MIRSVDNSRGFTLIELILIILTLGILGTIATIKMTESIETAKFEQTKTEMDNLASAIVGDPEVYSDGARTDFGFVGDNGALPTTLDDLVQNPGGWSTWDGPYIERGLNSDDFKRDGWKVNYSYASTTIQSTGSGSNIDKQFANSPAALLSNAVTGYIVDADRQIPPVTFSDSLTILLAYPNGSGSIGNVAAAADSHGRFSYAGVPIGNHTLRVIYDPDSDTVTYPITVYPARNVSLDIVFPADLW